MTAITTVPTRRMRNLLGYAGVIPFALLSAIALLTSEIHLQSQAVQAQIAYAAVILSFLGAIHWGMSLNSELDESLSLVWSVIPALLAWSVLLLPPLLALAVLPALFVSAFFIDRKLIFNDDFIRLRSRLTVIVITCLVVSFLAVLRTVQ